MFEWLGFIGGWLLFAGPVYQAFGELGAQESAHAEIDQVIEGITTPRRVATWWWLLPPIALILQYRRTREFQQVAFRALTPAQLQAWVRSTDKATGWWIVAAGAFLIALTETSRLMDALDLASWTTWPVSVAAAFLCLLYLAGRLHRSRRILSLAAPSSDSRD